MTASWHSLRQDDALRFPPIRLQTVHHVCAVKGLPPAHSRSQKKHPCTFGHHRFFDITKRPQVTASSSATSDQIHGRASHVDIPQRLKKETPRTCSFSCPFMPGRHPAGPIVFFMQETRWPPNCCGCQKQLNMQRREPQQQPTGCHPEPLILYSLTILHTWNQGGPDLQVGNVGKTKWVLDQT